MKKDFRQAIQFLNHEMLTEIREAVRNAGGMVYVPVYYEEYDTFPVEEILDEGFDVRVGEPDDNRIVILEEYGDKEFTLAAIKVDILGDPTITLVDTEQYNYTLGYYENPNVVCFIVEILRELCK